MRSKIVLSLSLLAALFAGGCFHAHSARREFDPALLPLAAEQNTPIFNFGVIRNISGADRRFMLRRENSEIWHDERNLWVLAPDNLLEKDLRLLLVSRAADRKSGEKPLLIQGVIYRFDFDLVRKSAVLGVEFTLNRGLHKTTWNELFITAYQENDAEARAAAMGQCIREAALSVNRHAQEFSAVPASAIKGKQ